MDAPVWVWPPGKTEPIPAGTCSWNETTRSGQFTYSPEYVEAGLGPLDPDQLSHMNPRQTIKVQDGNRDGLPGRFSDAGPDSWGAGLLKQDLGRDPNPLETLVFAVDDGAGNLALGDLAKKPPHPKIPLDQLIDALECRQTETSAPGILGQMISPDTALGGAQPKATIWRDGIPWIAKIPGKGGVINTPYYEAAAMRLAKDCEINVAEVDVYSMSDGQSIFLAKRFDREPHAEGFMRFGFASALTVMGRVAQMSGPERSYLTYAQKMTRWVHDGEADAKRELWKRIAFNCLVGNTDDHPRNQALLQKDGKWALAPAYDIVPSRGEVDKVVLAMGFLQIRKGVVDNTATGKNIITAAPQYGVSAEEAKELLLDMVHIIRSRWKDVLSSLKAPDAAYAQMGGMVNWSDRLGEQATAFEVQQIKSARKRSGWDWQPN